jgi:hypothetical protein
MNEDSKTMVEVFNMNGKWHVIGAYSETVQMDTKTLTSEGEHRVDWPDGCETTELFNDGEKHYIRYTETDPLEEDL